MTEWCPFMSYWGAYCKDVFQNAVMGSDKRIIFSEGLLRTLYYETDVGCIPRGIKLGSGGTAPKFTDKKNWNKQIQGCYWCQDDDDTFQGICCTRDCFYFLHEWCIERAMHFTRNRFCRLPGCDIVTYNDNIYCAEGHHAKFDCTFPKWTEIKSASLKSALRAGPIWYQQDQDSSKKTPNESNTHPQSNHTYNLRNKSTSNSTPFKCMLPLEFRSILIHQTDIGVVPRTCPSQEDLTSKYSQCPNWSAVIKGCYYCGRPETKDPMSDNFCRLRCYLLFYEWCRSKVESMVRMSFCRYPECTRKAAKGFQCCTRDHTVNISDLYKDNKINNIEQIISFAPKWYTKSDTPHELVPHLQTTTHSNNNDNIVPQAPQQPPIHYNPMINCLVSEEMTLFLYQFTDIGPIPRNIQMHLPPPQRAPPSPNWCVPINQCYWCCSGHPILHFIACSSKCLFLFIEWLHMKYEAFSNKGFCKSLGCGNLRSFGFNCCNRVHSSAYEFAFKEYFPLLRHTEFALGPMWYNEYTQRSIMFYNREDPFYEFTNFFPCDNLFMNNIQWRTSEHYFQAMKFYGTPYFHQVGMLPSPRDAFSFSRKPQVMKWTHPRWHSIKLIVMLNVLRAKFRINHFAQILLRTGDAWLIEHTKIDKFWGDGGDGSGENKLGILLMQVRSELRFANTNQTNQQILTQPSINTQLYGNATTHQEVNKQMQTNSCERNSNGKAKNETKSTSVGPNKSHESIHKTDSMGRQSVGVTPKPNDISETNDALNRNPFQPCLIDIKPGEAKYKLPADYKCPFIMDLHMGDDPTPSNKSAPIQSENDTTKKTDVSSFDPLAHTNNQEMDTPWGIDLIYFVDEKQSISNESTQLTLNNQRDLSIVGHNPFAKDNSEDKSLESADNSSSSPGCFDQSPSHSLLPPNAQSATSLATKVNPFAIDNTTDNESQNSQSSDHTKLTSETVNSASEIEGLLQTNSSSESVNKSVLSESDTTNLSIPTNCNPFGQGQAKLPCSDETAVEDETMDTSQPNDQIVPNSGSADQVHTSSPTSLVSKVSSVSS